MERQANRTAPAHTFAAVRAQEWNREMQTRIHGHGGAHAQGASARRRIRRTSHGQPLYCSTNGCATYLIADAVTGVATCPVCGARRRLH